MASKARREVLMSEIEGSIVTFIQKKKRGNYLTCREVAKFTRLENTQMER